MKVGLLGCGSIGEYVAKALDEGVVQDLTLAVVYDLNPSNATNLSRKLTNKPTVATSVGEMLDSGVDLVVEAASQPAVAQHAVEILSKGTDLMIMSVGALTDEKLLKDVEAAARVGGRLYVPSGAICGLDGVKSAAVGGITEVELTTTKPMSTLKGLEYVRDNNIRLDGATQPIVVFEGCARDAAKAFPKSINVSVALSLVGVGMDKTKVKIIADPTAETNTHELRIVGVSGEIKTKTVNRPTPQNPRTSYLAALSAVATLKNITARVCVGN